MGTGTKRRLLCCLACVLLVAGSVSAQSLTDEDRARFRDIFLMCRHPGGPMPVDDLRAYAQGHGFSDAEMAARLLAFAQEGLAENADAGQRRLARCAIGHLRDCGGETEAAFLRKLMRETEYGDLRQAAALVGMRLEGETWEEWLREAVADKRFGDFDRRMVYKNVFLIGRDGDEKTRQRVIEVLTEMRATDSCRVNQNRLGEWVAKLKGGDAWEAWLREVLADEGFYPANRKHAFEMALQAGRNGEKATRQHVIDVLEKMLSEESDERNRIDLRHCLDILRDNRPGTIRPCADTPDP
ncbi:MAG: hypothetical protein IJS32_06475 [Kiritimatiellae bacterium]|nr:hypothetical protein [Kiritimatiellia bacterium]